MKKGFEKIFLCLMVIPLGICMVPLLVSGTLCDPATMLDACYNNFPINSPGGASPGGFGAAEICSNCYQCGVQDGVCPEDFKTPGAGGLRGNCSECNDPDCSALLRGYVKRRDPPNQGVPHALVKAIPTNPHFVFWENMTTTDETGHYEIKIPSGKIVVSASKIGLDSEIIEMTSTSRDVVDRDFLLPNASCDENCTNYFGRCNKDCQGVNDCMYADWDGTYSRIADLCHDHKFGDLVVIGFQQDQTTNAICCRGVETFTERSPRFYVSGKMKDLVTSEIPALYGSRPVRIVIAIWPS